MNLDELQSIQSKERQTDSLQPLRESFYEEVGEYVQDLRAERERVAEEQGFDAPEFRRLSDEIDAAEDTVESLYERRVGKVVKAASFAAAGMPAEDEGLTAEEQDLFDTLVADIEQNRGRVLDVLSGDVEDGAEPAADTATAAPAGELPTDSAPSQADPTPDSGGVDAADLMGDGEPTPDSTEPTDATRPVPSTDGAEAPPTDEAEALPEQPGDDPAPDDGARAERVSDAPPTEDAPTETPSTADPSSDESADGSRTDPPQRSADGGSAVATVDRTTVRITRDVGEILGVDERAYDLGEDDVVTLPAANADPLVERDAAERLE